MKAGIKSGLINYKEILPKTNAKVCELYFRIDRKDDYDDLYRILKERNIQAGLHFWAVLPSGHMYNLAYPNKDIQKQSLDLIKETINIASQNQFRYVNVHPGNYCLCEMDLNKNRYGKIGPKANETEGNKYLFENTQTLHEYAQKQGVLYLTETVPSKDALIWYDEPSRLNPADIGYVRVSTIIELANMGFYVTNDLGHSLADIVSDDRTALFDNLVRITKSLAKETKLIHSNTSKPPFTGVDTHNGVLESDFVQNVLPTKQQIKILLGLFKNRSDIWVIPEPHSNHEQNFESLQNIINSL